MTIGEHLEQYYADKRQLTAAWRANVPNFQNDPLATSALGTAFARNNQAKLGASGKTQFDRRSYNGYVVKKLAEQGIEYAINVSMADMMKQTTATAAMGINQGFGADSGFPVISNFFKQAIRARRYRFATMMEEVGLQANRAALKWYRNSPARVHGVKGYRSNSRDSGGKMEQMLANPAMFRATPTGIAYGNITFMYSQARQWYRLNFGAGPAAHSGAARAPKLYPVSFFGEVIGQIGLVEFQPAPAFQIPAGWFGGTSDPTKRGEARGQEFHPIGAASKTSGEIRERVYDAMFEKRGKGKETHWRAIKSRGIVAVGYLDAAMYSISRNMPAGYTLLLREILAEGIEFPTKGPIAAAAIESVDAKKGLAAASVMIDGFVGKVGARNAAALAGIARR